MEKTNVNIKYAIYYRLLRQYLSCTAINSEESNKSNDIFNAIMFDSDIEANKFLKERIKYLQVHVKLFTDKIENARKEMTKEDFENELNNIGYYLHECELERKLFQDELDLMEQVIIIEFRHVESYEIVDKS